ncbi:hypothetical protein D0N87_22075 [Pseudomonas sp. ATCC 13867]|nr:hypothetical protein D0N87_22075 [Pseudomonas sp. ATCC 13867]
MGRYVEGGHLPIDDNHAGNAIHPFVIENKSWPLSGIPKGDTTSAQLYTLIETTKGQRTGALCLAALHPLNVRQWHSAPRITKRCCPGTAYRHAYPSHPSLYLAKGEASVFLPRNNGSTMTCN